MDIFRVSIMAFCENCGASIKSGDQFCENCGSSLGSVSVETKPVTPAQAVPSPAPATSQGEKNPVLAAIASLLFSGLGQVYNGSFGKGLLIFFGTLIGSMFFLVPGLIVLVYGIYDAYTTAKKMNEGQVPFVPYKTTHIIGFIVIGFVVMIIYFLVLVGLAMSMGGI
jgi:TM2 domain-containing membrane protein YozV